MSDVFRYTGSGSGGGVSGPGSSTDNAIARWDGTSGTLLQNSSAFVDDFGGISITQQVADAVTATALNIAAAAHINAPASTELIDVNIRLNRTVTFATGNLTDQRAFYIRAPTYAFNGSSTITNAYTFVVSGPPIAGTNATITNAFSMLSEDGDVCFTRATNAAMSVCFLGANTAGTARTVTFKGALSSTAPGADFNFKSSIARTAGSLFSVSNNTNSKLEVFWSGATLITESVVTGPRIPLLEIKGGAHTGLNSGTESTDVILDLARLVTFNVGALGIQRFIRVTRPTIAFSAGSTVSECVIAEFNAACSAGTNATIVNAKVIKAGGATTQVTNIDFTYSCYEVANHTVTMLGTTAMTSNQGVTGITIKPITVTDASAVTLDYASSLYIVGTPIAAGSLTITNTYSLFIDSGASRFDGIVYWAKGSNIASANDLPIGGDGNTFTITGTTQINAIQTKSLTAGTIFVLIFAGALTVKHNTTGGAGTATILLEGSVDLVTAANTVLTLVWDGTNFQEISRKVA